ncbi:MAG: endolytic transglycosylase MltG [Kistimonas sp.]|nr:endolytic transglycosylase MltG [Kistimonas sp.]
MKLARFSLIVFLALVLLVGSGVGAVYFWLSRPLVAGTSFRIVIQPGENFASIVTSMVHRGLLTSARWVRLYARVTGVDTAVRPGEYSFADGTSLLGLFAALTAGDVVQRAVTLVEGRTLAENLASWEKSYLSLTPSPLREEAIGALLEIRAPSPEGLFFADTYFYQLGDTDVSVLQRAHQRLLDVLAEEWGRREPGLPYASSYEALVMASLVERETAVQAERPRIAGVFIRRLLKRMRLQSDPTVIYGMGTHYKGHLRRRDLLRHTPYNTYRIRGLPPTPIALVGRGALHAALHPAQGTALYFVARGDGSHEFSDNLAAHNRAVSRYQLNRRDDYRSTPFSHTPSKDREHQTQ